MEVDQATISRLCQPLFVRLFQGQQHAESGTKTERESLDRHGDKSCHTRLQFSGNNFQDTDYKCSTVCKASRTRELQAAGGQTGKAIFKELTEKPVQDAQEDG